MFEIDPQVFSIIRPPLDDYKAFVRPDMVVESYQSAAGHMISHGSLHRISINRTAHRAYAYRLGDGPFRLVERPACTLGFQPAAMRLEVEGDAAEYISVFQAPELYRHLGGPGFNPDDRSGDALSALADPATLQVALSLALAAGEPRGADSLLLDHLGLALACCVVRLLHAQAIAQTHSFPQHHLRRVIDYIEGALGRPDLRVEELASVAHLSPFHFSRAFRQATGKAPYQFVLERRISRAQIRLAHSAESLATIAYASGFCSQAHFCTAFKRFTGVTPGKYRAQIRE